MPRTNDHYRKEAEGYMKSCTDTQVLNIIADEKKRAAAHSGDVARVARIMLRAAELEAARRKLI